jgi:NADH dehydrogenase
MTGLVTVFGGSGFVGRYIVRDLLLAGWRVRIAVRDPRDSLFLKPQGGLGQTQFMAADITKPATVARAVAGAEAVVNLVGILKGDFKRVQADGAANVAQAAAAAGVTKFVQMSAIGADAASDSQYGQTKGEGEAAVRAAFPNATIIRPSIIFGREDGFINRFAKMIASFPVVPIARGAVKFQPVFVGDVAAAVVKALSDGAAAGKTYELGGPDVMSMAQIQHWIAAQIGHHPTFIEMPDLLMGTAARFTGWLPGAPITWDQWLMLQHDNIVAPDAHTLADLHINPTPLDTVAEGWLVQYRQHGRFTTPAPIGTPA